MSHSSTNKSLNKSGVPHRKYALFATIYLIIGVFIFFRSRPSELERYQAQLRAQGEILDLDQLAPKRTGKEPDGFASLNDAKAQLSTNWDKSLRLSMDHEWQMNQQRRMQLTTTRFINAPDTTNRAAFWTAIENTIESNRSDLTLLRNTVKHPATESGQDYRWMLSNQISVGISPRVYARFFHIAAISDLHASSPAKESYSTMLALMNLTEFMRDEGLLTRQMIRLATIKLAHTATWYALESHSWDESNLKDLQTRWENVSIITNFYHSLLYERAFGHANFLLVQTERDRITQDVINYPGVYPAPTRTEQFWQWWRLTADLSDDHLTYLRNQQVKLELWRELINHPHWARAEKEFTDLEAARQRSFTTSFLPAKHILTQRLDFGHAQLFATVAKTETLRLQTITALALERHRLKHGHYPDTLTKLVPDYLTQIPQDPMDGRPLRYRLNPDGTFTLWSVGLDGKDDGGDPTMPDPKKQNLPTDARDLVWLHLDPIDLPVK